MLLRLVLGFRSGFSSEKPIQQTHDYVLPASLPKLEKAMAWVDEL